jgi:hypothetical protein
MRPLPTALVLCGLLAVAAPAMGQGTAPAGSVGSTATGDMPAKTGATTAVGQTKPAGDAVGDRLGTRPDLEEKSRDLDQKINKGICTGCK